LRDLNVMNKDKATVCF